ncbi:MAG TPA: class I SAM-dependent methyltransferase [Solirubrobacteraceae bacterium]|nr:class I SAM-dependent methyltransferase [Solirubrobacteraceae bacterium]
MEIFDDSAGQMSWGERAALEGILTQRRPGLAIAIGTADGAALAQIAKHADEVHSFDIVRPQLPVESFPNVTFLTGDSHELLPAMLAGLVSEGRNVDFVLVNGDHSPAGVRRDVEDLLDSPAVGDAALLIHDASNERVREGLDAIHFAAWAKVARVELDFVVGYMIRETRLRHAVWGGLALVVVDAARRSYGGAAVVANGNYPAAELLASARELVIARERGEDVSAIVRDAAIGDTRNRVIAELQAELDEATTEIERLGSVARHHEALWNSLMDSFSWRLTAPVRLVKDRVRGLLGGR